MITKEEYVFSVRSEWDLKLALEKNPEVSFYKNSDYKES